MNDRLVVRLCRSTALLAVVLTLVAGTAIVFLTSPRILLSEGGAFALFAVFFGAVVWYVIPTQVRNRVLWILAGAALGAGIYVAGWALAAAVSPDVAWVTQNAGDLVPAELVKPAAWTLVIAIPMGTVGVVGLLTFGLLLFPDGCLPSPRWRWAALFSAIAVAATGVAGVVMYLPSRSEPAETTSLGGLLDLSVGLAVLLSLGALAHRFRISSGEMRQQLKWVLWGASLLIVSLGLLIVAEGTAFEASMLAVFAFAGLAFVLSYAVALAKYRLFDVDVVISKTFVYGSLAVFIGAVYVGVVVGLSALLDTGDAADTWLGIGATVVVAITFQPLRRRLERLANRIVYGRRATPYEVLSSFSQGISAVDPEVLGQVAKSLAEGTTADSASIWVGVGESSHCVAAWPVLPDDLDPSAVSAPVLYDEEELGRVVLQIPPGQPFPETDRRLLSQVSGGLGLALRNMQLTEALRDRVDELAASRRRIVTVQDETRRQLERDLHDGAQQRLVALKIKVGIGSAMAGKAGLADVQGILDTVREETDQAIDTVRDFARGIYPPLLEAEGLGRAINAQARNMPIPFTVQAAGLGRYPKDQEATVYFCVLEALQNAMKHSGASSVQVLLADRDGELSFEVRDDGVGFDKTAVDPNGLLNMKDRVEAIGGRFDVESQPGRGTTVSGALPIRELVGA